MFEHDVDILLAGDFPDGLTELAALAHIVAKFRAVHLGQLTPALEVLAVEHTLGAHGIDEIVLVVRRHHADGMGAGHRAELDPETAKPAGRAPDQDIVAWLHDVRAVAEQHAVGGRERQRVAGAFFPGQMLWTRHALARLHAAELGKAAIGGLIAPDALGRREHRVAAIALLIVAIVLVAVDDDLVARFHAGDLASDRPDNARGVGPGDMEVGLVDIEGRDWLSEAGPDAVIVHAGGHHEDEHFVAVNLRHRHLFQLHGGGRAAMALTPDRPGIHHFRDVKFRRNLTDFVDILPDPGDLRVGHTSTLRFSSSTQHFRRGSFSPYGMRLTHTPCQCK